jgi:hypothetical protein
MLFTDVRDLSGLQVSAILFYVLHVSPHFITALSVWLHSQVETVILVLIIRLLIMHGSITLEGWGIVHCGGHHLCQWFSNSCNPWNDKTAVGFLRFGMLSCPTLYNTRSKSLWWWYISTNIMFLDVIHSPVYISKHNISETGFCFRLQVKPTQLGPIDRTSTYLWRWWIM